MNADLQPLALILDDSPFLALHLAQQLGALGLRAQRTASREELLTLAGSAAVVLIELQHFAANGFQVTRELASSCSCPIILLSGTGRSTDLHWGLRAGARAVLTRPVQASALHSALQHLGCCGEACP